MHHVAETAQGLKGKVLKKNFVLPHRILVFHFFSLSFLLMVLHDVIFNVTVTILVRSFEFFQKSLQGP
jgi:hypothetical protein